MKPDPKKSILNEAWRYVPSAETDIRKLFARIRREQRLPEVQTRAVVLPIAKKK